MGTILHFVDNLLSGEEALIMPNKKSEKQEKESRSLSDLGMKRYVASMNPPDDNEVHGIMEIRPSEAAGTDEE
jgi:hypothetical protein